VLAKAERLQVYYDLDLLQRWALGNQTFFKVRKSQIRKFLGSLIPLSQIRKFLRPAIPQTPNPMLQFRYVYVRSRILIFIHPGYRNQDLGFYFKTGTEKNLAHRLRIKVLFTQKIVTKISEIWVVSGYALYSVTDPDDF
jgi:hypothetical protein